MRTLQVFGIFVGVVIGLYGFWKYKRGAYNRTNFLISIGLAAGLLIISVFPSAGDFIAFPLKMDRWNGVLFISVLLLLALFFYTLNQANGNSRTISRLIQSLAHQRFLNEYPDRIKGDLLILIPAYNEADNIGDVLVQIPHTTHGLQVQPLVVVDGATDGTEQVVRSLGIPMIVNPINRGGGSALRAGYQIAVENKIPIVVTLDADGQHDPSEIEKLVEPILNDEADFVNGSRILGSYEKESVIRSTGVVFFNWLITILMGERITDSSNSFRAIRTQMFSQLTLSQDQFHTSELLIAAIKKGARVKEVGITIRKRQSGTTKKPRSLKYGWGFMKAILGTWLR